MKLREAGIRDIKDKHVIHCTPVGGGPPWALLWRTKPEQGGRPLPKVGEILERAGCALVVRRIEAPGSMEEIPGENPLVIKPERKT